MRYLAAVIFIILGLFVFAGSTVVGIGVHLSGNAWVGLPLAATGIAFLLLSAWTVRDLFAEPLVRGVVSVVLALGSVHLITGLTMLGLGIRSGFDDPSFDSGATIYSVGFGAMCVAALVLIYRPRFLQQQKDRNSPPGSLGDIR